MTKHNRRKFLAELAKGAGGATLLSQIPFWSYACGTSPDDQRKLNSAHPFSISQDRKLGIALVGLGNYSRGQLAPALQQTQYCKLSGIVTGTPAKADEWSEKYQIPDKNIYNYDNFDDIANNPDIDIIYIVLPNGMHAEYTIRAAQAGKHVICEKPMANSVKECAEMIAACKKAGKQLSIGYRLHFDPYNREMMRLGQKKVYGPIQSIDAGFAFKIGNPDQWRLDKELAGGGPLMDIGIYAIQGTIYTLGQVPTAVTAEKKTFDPVKFDEVEEFIRWELEFPSGLKAPGKCSYSDNYNYVTAQAKKAKFGLSPAYSYNGLSGFVDKGQGSEKFEFPVVNQQARQMDAFAQCLLNDKPTTVPGEMGLRDMVIVEGMYERPKPVNGVTFDTIPQVLDKVKKDKSKVSQSGSCWQCQRLPLHPRAFSTPGEDVPE
ncbi:MAG: Gfo/Idh/MocA family oxidoreductase [Bacteroidia bacterium]|nr:Gfo/Idh/MocA family oxidoreductase [Bacteroidia bacterium]